MSEQMPETKPMPESMLYEAKTREGKMIGFSTPEGVFYHFNDGEELVQIRPEVADKRETFVRTKDGTDVPVDAWISSKLKKAGEDEERKGEEGIEEK